MSSPSAFRCQHKGRSSWDTHPSCVTCRIREGILCARDNPCHFCQSWDKSAWHNQDLRVDKVRRDWVATEKELSATPLFLSQGATSQVSRTPWIRSLVAPSSARSEPVAAHPLDISREALDRALSLSQDTSILAITTRRSYGGRHPILEYFSIV